METSNIDFKNIWKQQKVEEIDIEQLLLKLEKFKRSSLNKLIFTNIAFLITLVLLICIWYYFQPQYITTKIGISLVILSMVIFLFYNNKSFSEIKKLDFSQDNASYLQSLIGLKNKQMFMQTKMLSLYFLMLSTGLALYLYEYTLRMKISWAILAYGLSFAWIALNWFYIRPKTIKKQNAKIDDLIQKFRSIDGQLLES